MSDGRAERLELMRFRRIEVDDSKARRCWYCGEWAWAEAACSACRAPANKADLRGEGVA